MKLVKMKVVELKKFALLTIKVPSDFPNKARGVKNQIATFLSKCASQTSILQDESS